MMKKDFQVIVVENNNIEDHDWAKPDYIRSILNESYTTLTRVAKERNEYLHNIGNLLNYTSFNSPEVESHVIGIEKEYIYEIVYMKYDPKKEDINNIKPNGVGVLFDLQGDDVFNTVIFQKLKTPLDGSEKYYEDITIEDLEKLMKKRLWTTVVIYEDDKFREEEITGPFEIFSDLFFEEDNSRVKKIEIGFLKHNLNIWYLEDKDFGNTILGNLIENKPKIFKCVFFTKITEDRRENLTLDEVKIIIELSEKLDNFDLNIKDDDIEQLKKNKYEILWDYNNKLNI